MKAQQIIKCITQNYIESYTPQKNTKKNNDIIQDVEHLIASFITMLRQRSLIVRIQWDYGICN